jgi:hypothetical protein
VTRRVVILGATGSFGSNSRRPGLDLRCDVEDPASLRAALRPGDVVLDCVGPFQDRSTALAEAAIEVGFDLVDLSDGVDHARAILALDARARESGVHLLPGQSSVSALAGRAIRASGVEDPVEVLGLLVPAARHTAAVGSAASLLRSLGGAVRVLEGGEEVTRPGWRTTRDVSPPDAAPVRGHLFESADVVHLPAAYPGLQATALYVHSNVLGLDAALSLADRVPGAPALLSHLLRLGTPITRLLGGAEGLLAYEIRGADGATHRVALRAAETSPRIPVLPMALAARRLAEGWCPGPGVLPPARELDDAELDALLERNEVRLEVG